MTETHAQINDSSGTNQTQGQRQEHINSLASGATQAQGKRKRKNKRKKSEPTHARKGKGKELTDFSDDSLSDLPDKSKGGIKGGCSVSRNREQRIDKTHHSIMRDSWEQRVVDSAIDEFELIMNSNQPQYREMRRSIEEKEKTEKLPSFYYLISLTVEYLAYYSASPDARKKRKPTVLSYASYLGFNSLPEYEHKMSLPHLSPLKKRIELWIESYLAEALIQNPTGQIFYLKNKHEWVDSKQVTHDVGKTLRDVLSSTDGQYAQLPSEKERDDIQDIQAKDVTDK